MEISAINAYRKSSKRLPMFLHFEKPPFLANVDVVAPQKGVKFCNLG